MSKKDRNIAIGAAVGAAVGFMTGILTAKKSGKETRADIKNTTIATKLEAEKKIKEVTAQLSDLLKTAELKVKDSKSSAKENLQKAISRANLARDKAREVISSLHDGDAPDDELKQALEEAKSAIKHLNTYVATISKTDKK